MSALVKRYSVYVAEQYPPIEWVATGIDEARRVLLRVRERNPGQVVLVAAEDCEDDPRRGLTAEEAEVLQ